MVCQFKLHLLCNKKGEIINFVFTKANVETAMKILLIHRQTKYSVNCMQIKDIFYQLFFGKLFNNGVHIVTGLRSNMKQCLIPLYDKLIFRKHNIIESLHDVIKIFIIYTHPSSLRS